MLLRSIAVFDDSLQLLAVSGRNFDGNPRAQAPDSHAKQKPEIQNGTKQWCPSCRLRDLQYSCMRFVDGGPDIPETLLRAHLAGEVVFVVGAGLSQNARLPDFKTLVERTDTKEPYGRTAADMAKAQRGRSIQAGAIPGLFEKGTKKLCPEIRALIDAAVAKRANED